MDMRSLIDLCEGAIVRAKGGEIGTVEKVALDEVNARGANTPAVTSQLVKLVQGRLKKGQYYGDYEVPKSAKELAEDIDSVLFNISANTVFINGGFKLWRAEKRHKSDFTKANIQTAGVFWAWRHENAIPIYGSDHGREIHGDVLISAVFEAVVPPQMINWPATIAANLALPQEREITLNQDATVQLTSIQIEGRTKPVSVNKVVHIDNLTMYDKGD